MKRASYALLAAIVLTLLTGCQSYLGRRPLGCVAESCAQSPENCASCTCDTDNCQDPGRAICRACAGRGCRLCRGGEGFVAGPATGTITYPYYTVRGPRDFLARNPQSIGP